MCYSPGVTGPCIPLLSVSLVPERGCIVESETVLLSVCPEADVLSLCVSEHTLWEHSISESFDTISVGKYIFYHWLLKNNFHIPVSCTGDSNWWFDIFSAWFWVFNRYTLFLKLHCS